MPCSGTAGASRITNANEGSTLPVTPMQRIANFFPGQWGSYSHLTHSPQNSSVLLQLKPPNLGYRTPSAATNGFHLTNYRHPGSPAAPRYTTIAAAAGETGENAPRGRWADLTQLSQ